MLEQHDRPGGFATPLGGLFPDEREGIAGLFDDMRGLSRDAQRLSGARGGVGAMLYDNIYRGYSPAGKNTINLMVLQGYGPWEKFEHAYLAGNKAAYRKEAAIAARSTAGTRPSTTPGPRASVMRHPSGTCIWRGPGRGPVTGTARSSRAGSSASRSRFGEDEVAESRRRFLQSAALTIGPVGTLGAASQQASGSAGAAGAPPQAGRGDAPPPAAPVPASTVQVPKMRFGGVEISRLVVGCNPFYGYAHYNAILAAVMREQFTPERVCDVLHQCNRFGINACCYVDRERPRQDLDRFLAEGAGCT